MSDKINQDINEELGYTEEDLIYLTGDNGEEIAFYHEATVEFEGEWYVLAHPVVEQEDIAEDEIIIFHLLKDTDGEDVLEGVEDEELLEKVYEIYIQMVEDYNNNIEEE